ncbi:hypothetical protein ACM0P6_09910 [Komagataeibacter sucrofermentans]|uniref:hypothetical protein n=1 Tax=Komagataeibacter sucrofermentans TaxID=1053551 RepID=UPI0011B38D19|nr:hypothetical protein [Komagataeibacter sucrofermentans]GBQ44194.1 hypothetical protein AA15973_0234 [Komagataeibacter sucrofermentans DSM 15973]
MKNDKKLLVLYLKIVTSFVFGAIIGYIIASLSGIKPSFVPLVSAVLGLLVAFSMPLWQALFVNAPNLSVEISAIKRTVSDTAIISLDDDPEIRPLITTRKRQSLPFDDESNILNVKRQVKRGYTLAQTEELLANAKQSLRDLPSQIEERKKELDRVNALTSTTLTKYECDRLNSPLYPEVDFDPSSPEKSLDALREAYQKRLERLEKRYTDLQSNLPAWERKIELLKKELFDNRSYFTVSASLINSGRTNTAVKVPSLLRVSIGEGNYIDIKLSLKDFEDKSEISANGTRIVVFESSEVSSLPEDDRNLINTYWGQSVSSRLFIEDIHSNIYSSNTIAFAEGLYQKIIYDRLARAASTEEKR